MTETAPKLYDMDAAAAYFGKAKTTIERWVREGKLTGSNPAGQWYFTDADFIAFIERGRDRHRPRHTASDGEPTGRSRDAA